MKEKRGTGVSHNPTKIRSDYVVGKLPDLKGWISKNSKGVVSDGEFYATNGGDHFDGNAIAYHEVKDGKGSCKICDSKIKLNKEKATVANLVTSSWEDITNSFINSIPEDIRHLWEKQLDGTITDKEIEYLKFAEEQLENRKRRKLNND